MLSYSSKVKQKIEMKASLFTVSSEIPIPLLTPVYVSFGGHFILNNIIMHEI